MCKKLKTYERDNLVVNTLMEHRGAEDCIIAKELQKILADHGYKLAQWSVGQAIRHIMYERKLPICFINGKGYYWAIRKAELEATIADLTSRMNALQEHIDHLSKFLMH